MRQWRRETEPSKMAISLKGSRPIATSPSCSGNNDPLSGPAMVFKTALTVGSISKSGEVTGFSASRPLDDGVLSAKIDTLSEELGIKAYFGLSVSTVFRVFNYLRLAKATGTLVASVNPEEGQS